MAKRIILLGVLLALSKGIVFSQTDSAKTNNVGIQYLGHIAIGVSDLDRAMHFYCDQLGLTEVFRLNGPSGPPMLIYLRVNDNNFVELFPGSEGQAQGESKRAGLRHLGFFVKDLQATLHSLQARGLTLSDDAFKQAALLRADGTFLYFIRDPDGNAIELSQLTPVSKQTRH